MKTVSAPKRKSKNINNILIIVISIMLVLVVALVFIFLHQKTKMKNEKPSQVTTTNFAVAAPTINNNTTAPNAESSQISGSQPPATQAVSPTVPTTAPRVDPASWSASEVLAYAADAINRTKAYTGSVSVHHTESFNANITSITGGNLVKQFANSLMSNVVKPKDETLSFSGGYATNSDGEQTSMLLPDGKSFSLPIDGVSSASAYASDGDTVINISVVTENTDMNTIPPYNSSCVGYLDVSKFDLSILTVTACNIQYVGTTISLTINGDGYVKLASYNMPMSISGEGTGMGIKGEAQFDGAQTENWNINW